MIEEHLRLLGLNANERKALISLAEIGKASATSIAKRVKLPRSTAYFALENLARRGLVKVQRAGKASWYIAEEAAALSGMVDAEARAWEEEFETRKTAALEAQKLLEPLLRRENFSVPHLQFFEGREGVEKMLRENCEEWQKSICFFDKTWWGYQDHQFVEGYRKWLNHYWSRMVPGERILLLSNESATEKNLEGRIARRQIKMLPRESQFSSTVWVLGDYIVSIMTRQKPHYAFQLKDAVFASNQRKTFQLIWRLL